jgi:hypothetical protein
VTRTARETGRYLRVHKGGSFEIEYLGSGGHKFTASLSACGAGGRTVTSVLYSMRQAQDLGCFPGLSLLGSFDLPTPFLVLDLAAGGIEIGEEVEITVAVTADAGAVEACQWTFLSALLIVDDFEFCTEALAADLDGDGAIGLADLVVLLAAWGPCPPPGPGCAADLDGDGAVGFEDLVILLASWG